MQNTGAYLATRIAVELVKSTGAPAGFGTLDRALVPGDTDSITVMTPPRDLYAGPYTIYVEWDDGRGRNREATGRTVGAPA